MTTEERDAFDSIQTHLDALTRDELRRPLANLLKSARRAVQGGEFLASATVDGTPLLEALRTLPANYYSMWGPEHLTTIGLAAAYVHQMREESRAVSDPTRRRLPREISQQAQKIRRRMLAVCTFFLEHLDSASAVLAHVRKDRSYDTLDADLGALADLYEEHHSLVSVPSPYYRETDLQEAREMRRKILSLLDQSTDELRWNEAASRVWTLLERAYRETRRGTLFLLHDQEDLVNAKLPSLFIHTRRPSSTPASEPTLTPATDA